MNKTTAATTPPKAAPTSGGICAPIRPTDQTISDPTPAPEPSATDAFGFREITLPERPLATPASTAASDSLITPPSPASRRHRIDCALKTAGTASIFHTHDEWQRVSEHRQPPGPDGSRSRRTDMRAEASQQAPSHSECFNELVTDDHRYLLAAIKLAQQARDNGNHPFGALLVDSEGRVVVESENTVVTGRDCTGHAETNVMRLATERFDAEFLQGCTLYTSTEPCAMCSGAIFWGNVRKVVFALSEEDLRGIASPNLVNATLAIPCREIFARGNHDVEVSGPHLEEQARAVHDGFWS